MRGIAYPFQTLDEASVGWRGWRVSLSSSDGTWEDPAFLPDWDPATDIRLRADFSPDFKRASESLGISADELALELLVMAGTGTESMPAERWVLHRALLAPGASGTIDARIRGGRLAGNLFLDVLVLLSEPVAHTKSRIVPSRRGAILWRDSRRIRLEGDVSRFPMAEVDLSRMLGEEFRDAPWFLEVDWEDPNADFDTAVRLYLNSNSEIAKRVRDADPASLHAVMADVMIQIVEGWFSKESDGLDADDGSSESSLAGVASMWASLAFGSARDARRMLEVDRGRFHARLAAVAHPGEAGQ